MVLVIHNGNVLAPGADYEWRETAPSHTIRFTFELNPSDVVQFVPLGSGKREIYMITEQISTGEAPAWGEI